MPRDRYAEASPWTIAFVLIALAGPWQATEAVAQPASTLTLKAMKVGDCRVVVQLTNPRGGDGIGIVIEQTRYPEQTVSASDAELSFGLAIPLRRGFRVRATRNGEDVLPDVVVPAPADGGGGAPEGLCTQPDRANEDSPFDASAYLGTVIDTFAPDSIGNYKNPAAGTDQKLRKIFGIDFDYRAAGSDDSPVQFWINGETLHGVRTADIDCSAADTRNRPPVCSNTSPFPDRARYILEHADSLEAFVSPRLEFATLQKGTEAPAKVYVTTRLGFIALEQAPRVFRSFHTALGLLADGGTFAGSYFEVGLGKNELFSGTTWRRIKIDGLLSFNLEKALRITDSGRFFVEMLIDNDLRDGADSVQTFFGVDVDLKKAFAP